MARRPQFVLDAAPLIALAAAGALDRILALDARFLVAEEVRDEVIGTAGQERRPESTAVEERIREGEIEVARVRDEGLLRRVGENARLSSADCASLCLALERGARLIADDRDLRAAARGLGADVGGSLFLLALGVDQGLSTGKEAVATVEKMVAAGWYCSPALLKGFTDAMVGK